MSEEETKEKTQHTAAKRNEITNQQKKKEKYLIALAKALICFYLKSKSSGKNTQK